jgi:hypothetical protein
MFSFVAGRLSRRDSYEPLKAAGCSVHLVGGSETAAELDTKFAIYQACRQATQIWLTPLSFILESKDLSYRIQSP